jgi:hypothetical protein
MSARCVRCKTLIETGYSWQNLCVVCAESAITRKQNLLLLQRRKETVSKEAPFFDESVTLENLSARFEAITK